MIYKATEKDSNTIATLAINMWQNHTLEDLAEEFESILQNKECESWAKRQGCKEFASDCELDNATSHAFHLKAGFAEANRIICFTKEL